MPAHFDLKTLRHVGFSRNLATVLAACCLLAACTASFTYNRLDWLIPWYVDSVVDLSGDQKKTLRQQLEPVLQWHREEELARYIDILNQIETDLAGPVTAGQVQAWIDEVIKAAERVEASMIAVALDFGAGVRDEQMREFTAALWEQQREYEEEYLQRSDEEYRQENYEYLGEFMERFTGRLSPGQEQRLREGSDALRRFDAAWLDERRAWLETLEPLLQRPVGWQEAIKRQHAERTSTRTPEYLDIVDYNLGVISQAMADVLNQSSTKQREHIAREFESLRVKLRKLMDRARSKQKEAGTRTGERESAAFLSGHPEPNLPTYQPSPIPDRLYT